MHTGWRIKGWTVSGVEDTEGWRVGEGVEVERWKVEGGWMMGGESNGPGQVKHPEKQIFHTTLRQGLPRPAPPHI